MENQETGKQSLKIAKGIIKKHIFKKDRQFNGLLIKNNKINNGGQNIKQKTIDLATLF
jgi:hypothetical protein